jgi:hypothetical protein
VSTAELIAAIADLDPANIPAVLNAIMARLIHARPPAPEPSSSEMNSEDDTSPSRRPPSSLLLCTIPDGRPEMSIQICQSYVKATSGSRTQPGKDEEKILDFVGAEGGT